MTHSTSSQYADLTKEEREELGSRILLNKSSVSRAYFDLRFTSGRRMVGSVLGGQDWEGPDTTLAIMPDWTKPTRARRNRWYQIRVYNPVALGADRVLIELRNCGHRHQSWAAAQRCLDQLRNRGMTLEERRMGWLCTGWRNAVVMVEVWE